MENRSVDYKQAVIIGAASLGEEAKQLLSLLKWAGYDKSLDTAGTKTPAAGETTAKEPTNMSPNEESCNHKCSVCAKACGTRALIPDVCVIAADGGLKFLYENHMMPDFWVGDLDSLYMHSRAELPREFFLEIEKIPHQQVPVEKDDTDMALAVAKAYELGYQEILMYGGCGGRRISHTLANIQLMRHYADKLCHIRMMGNGIRMEILQPGVKTFSAAMKGNLSVICLSDSAEWVKIKGLKYEYDGPMTSSVALGVSNSFVGKDAFIEVSGGVLLLVFEKAH